MMKKEIRKKVRDKKGNIHNKLVCATLVKEDGIYIAIKNKAFPEPILVDMLDLIAPYIDEENIKVMRTNINTSYKIFKNKAS